MSVKNLSKQEIQGKMLSPLPIALVGAQVNNKPNYLVIGYMCPFNFGKHIFFSLYNMRYTRKGIHENMNFNVNIPSENLIKETELCGTKFGRDIDKSTIFDTFYGELKTTPMISQCPINIECEVTEILDYNPNEEIISRVVKSHANPEYFTDGKLDWRKVRPILWVIGGDNNFYKSGERILQKEE